MVMGLESQRFLEIGLESNTLEKRRPTSRIGHLPSKRQRAVHYLLKSGSTSVTPELDNLINLIKKSPKDSLASQYYIEVKDHFLENAKRYEDLQRALAEKIPVEFLRPTIDLKFIFGDQTPLTENMGILGGSGPLADADLIKTALNGIDDLSKIKNKTIHLLSMPPPRTIWDLFSIKGFLYAIRLLVFSHHGYQDFIVASNTAHLKIGTLNFINGTHGAVKDLTKKVVLKIKSSQQESVFNEPILILGTTQAYNHRLYGKIFEAQGIETTELEACDQKVIQDYIDGIKAYSDKLQVKKTMSRLIKRLSHKYHTKTMLLGCTELCVAMHGKIGKILNDQFDIIDSQNDFAKFIGTFLQKV